MPPKVEINLNPYQGLKRAQEPATHQGTRSKSTWIPIRDWNITRDVSGWRSKKVEINLNPYQGLKHIRMPLSPKKSSRNQLESLSGIETREARGMLAPNPVEINLNPYQGLKRLSVFFRSRRRGSRNQLESLSGIETNPPRFLRLLFTSKSTWIPIRDWNFSSKPKLTMGVGRNQLESLSGIETLLRSKCRQTLGSKSTWIPIRDWN